MSLPVIRGAGIVSGPVQERVVQLSGLNPALAELCGVLGLPGLSQAALPARVARINQLKQNPAVRHRSAASPCTEGV
jgi:hypothetical protein